MLANIRAAVLGALVLSTPWSAQADEVHHQAVLGDRALGMGGAFVGVADDPSATFYNPAGLALLEADAVSGSLTVHAFDHREIEDGYGSPIGQEDLQNSGRRTVPIFVSVVKKVGKRDAERRRRHALSVATFHPSRRRLRFEVDARDMASGVRDSLTVDHENRTIWVGGAYALRVTDELALGLSAFYSRHRTTHTESRTVITEGMRTPVGVFENSTLSVRESQVRLSAEHAVLRVGAVYDAHPDWRIGLMFQPPGIPIDEDARLEDQRSFADLLASPAIATFFHSDQRVSAEAPIPWELRVGVGYRPSAAFTMSLDASLYGANGSSGDPIRVLGDAEPDQETGEVPQAGDFFVQSYHRRLTGNVALGMETVIADAVPLRLGFFTDLSAAPDISGPTDTYAFADIHRFGAALAIGYRTDDYDLDVGVAGRFGRGTALGLNPQAGLDPVPETYVPVDVVDRSIFVYITGYKRAAAKIAKRVYKERLQGD